jgi:hypothetical protein
MIQLPTIETVALAKKLEARAFLKNAQFRFQGARSSRMERNAFIAINVRLMIRPRMALSVSLRREESRAYL